jgi:hypothetical protein
VYRRVLEGEHHIEWEMAEDTGEKDAPGPKRSTKRGKATNWNIPYMNPYPEIHKPMDAGLMLRPPNSTDVDHTNGVRVPAAISSSAITL